MKPGPVRFVRSRMARLIEPTKSAGAEMVLTFCIPLVGLVISIACPHSPFPPFPPLPPYLHLPSGRGQLRCHSFAGLRLDCHRCSLHFNSIQDVGQHGAAFQLALQVSQVPSTGLTNAERATFPTWADARPSPSRPTPLSYPQRSPST